ncbi:hypothetical protein [Micromonospora maris]|uniref:hypothetical protein n=1 Tax=Micromonospora maris TaxID=1003110 RepID=UPI002E0ED1F4|nr:hypothetical protein OG712_05410 [Micromonospora maris]
MIVLLGLAFGVLQAGLVDQSLFNPDFLADTEFAEISAADQTASRCWGSAPRRRSASSATMWR